MVRQNRIPEDSCALPVETPPDVGFSLGMPSAKRPPIPGSRDGAEDPSDGGPAEPPLLLLLLLESIS
jgi:hypothetical protein